MHEMWSSFVAGHQFQTFLQQVQMLLDSAAISRWLTTSWATQLSCSLTTGHDTFHIFHDRCGCHPLRSMPCCWLPSTATKCGVRYRE
eukprot:s1988_g4.t1